MLSSKSELKKNAVESFFSTRFPKLKLKIECFDCTNSCGLPPQPISCGAECTFQRTRYVSKIFGTESYDMIISIENDMDILYDGHYDNAHARIEMAQFVGVGISDPIKCPINIMNQHQQLIHFTKKIRGVKITGGDMLHEKHNVSSNNWMKELCGIDRKDQIICSLERAFNDLKMHITNCHNIQDSYTSYADFPKRNVMFKYLYSIFAGEQTTYRIGNMLHSKYSAYEFDLVLPIESRGIVFGSILSDRLKISMIPIQKPGKTPGHIVSMNYQKENEIDQVEFSLDLFKKFLSQHNQQKIFNVIIVKDIITTGERIVATLKILAELSEIYSIKFDTTIFAFDEVPALRDHTVKNIGLTYDILQRDVTKINERMKLFNE